MKVRRRIRVLAAGLRPWLRLGLRLWIANRRLFQRATGVLQGAFRCWEAPRSCVGSIAATACLDCPMAPHCYLHCHCLDWEYSPASDRWRGRDRLRFEARRSNASALAADPQDAAAVPGFGPSVLRPPAADTRRIVAGHTSHTRREIFPCWNCLPAGQTKAFGPSRVVPSANCLAVRSGLAYRPAVCPAAARRRHA